MIRPYEITDQESVVEVWYAASLIAHDFVPSSFWEAERQNIKSQYLPVAQTWVYECDGKVVGFISLLENHIGGLFVDPQYQGRGIGTQLIAHAKTLHPALSLDVFKQNIKSRQFYERLGFTVTAENIHEPTGCTNLTMKTA